MKQNVELTLVFTRNYNFIEQVVLFLLGGSLAYELCRRFETLCHFHLHSRCKREEYLYADVRDTLSLPSS